ncbi:MAG TPA: HupE/UreJ family protein [Woeseiaceae bacterium]|nr:HupE/UreJ family protein [Woeseiaceae bacterium]
MSSPVRQVVAGTRVTIRSAVRIVAASAIVMLALTAWSHPLSVSYSRFEVDGQVLEAVYRLPMDDIDLLLQLDADLDGMVSPRELGSARDRLGTYIRQHASIEANGFVLQPELQRIATWLDRADFAYVSIVARYVAPERIERLEIAVGVLTDLYPDHRNLAEVFVGGELEEYVFQHGNRWVGEVGNTGWWQTAREFTRLGVEHIFTGYDHLMFLLGLLLVGRGLRDLFTIVSAFTVAHSVTLALAALGIVHPAIRVVEAAIALSIAYVGLENLVVRTFRHRWMIAGAFGLVHGFGFAAVLQETRPSGAISLLALFTFNAGVEIGQLAIVALAWPLLAAVRSSDYRETIVRAASLLIVACGAFWFVERIA